MSIICRTWSGIRSRQALKHLEQWIPWGASGFMPGRGTTDIWFLIEAQVKSKPPFSKAMWPAATPLTLSRPSMDFHGSRCLRSQVKLGIPWQVIRPWEAFIGGLHRRFMISGCVSEPVESTSGFPEGCPLSPVAMCIADILLRFYMREFQPRVHCLSFVDNLSGTCHSALRCGAWTPGYGDVL